MSTSLSPSPSLSLSLPSFSLPHVHLGHPFLLFPLSPYLMSTWVTPSSPLSLTPCHPLSLLSFSLTNPTTLLPPSEPASSPGQAMLQHRPEHRLCVPQFVCSAPKVRQEYHVTHRHDNTCSGGQLVISEASVWLCRCMGT